MKNIINTQIIEHELSESEYRSLIPVEATTLLTRVESHKATFPKSVEVFGNLLRTHSKRHPLLEDWLLIPHFQFFWDADKDALRWFENLFEETISLIGDSFWEQWQQELLRQTDCETTHAICDRLYDYQLQLCGGLYLARKGWTVEYIPSNPKGKAPDMKGIRKNEECILESTFVHTSEKYGSFWHRAHRTARKYAQPSPPVLFCEQFILPSSLEIKSLTPLDCTLLKAFLQKVYENPTSPQIGISGKTAFYYFATLPTAMVPIDSQYECAQDQGENFATEYLKRLVDQKSSQLKKQEYANCKQILFIGLQPDTLYFAPWNESVITKVKSSLKAYADTLEIEAIFSEDVSFPVKYYI